jgi:hypothetical protein
MIALERVSNPCLLFEFLMQCEVVHWQLRLALGTAPDSLDILLVEAVSFLVVGIIGVTVTHQGCHFRLFLALLASFLATWTAILDVIAWLLSGTVSLPLGTRRGPTASSLAAY